MGGLTRSRISSTAAKLGEFWRRYSRTALSALLSSGGLGRLGVALGVGEVMLREPILSSSAVRSLRAIAGFRDRMSVEVARQEDVVMKGLIRW